MQQTLFTIPQYLFEGPLLIAWLIFSGLMLAYLWWRHGWGSETYGFIPMIIVGAAVIYFLFPNIAVTDINPDDPNGPEIKVGLAVRGYGVMLLLGLLSGVTLCLIRGRQVGVDPDRMLSFVFWTVISGIVGARLFYVIQKRDQFTDLSPANALASMLDMTQGGLVVYGSMIGAMLGGAIYLWLHKMPVLKVADAIAPGMVLGLAIGRVGCLMNGCCYGGDCDIPQIAQNFPAGSPPYMRQLDNGELLGIHAEQKTVADESGQQIEVQVVGEIKPQSLADQQGLVLGKPYAVYYPSDKHIRAVKQKQLKIFKPVVVMQNGSEFRFAIDDLADYSGPIFPAQLISAINAALLTLVLWFYFPLRRYDGQVFALLLVLYAVTRFLLEFVRTDESGQFGTPFTISQLVSIAMLMIGFAMFAMCQRRADGPIDDVPLAAS